MFNLKFDRKLANLVFAVTFCSGMLLISNNTFADSSVYLGGAYGQTRVEDSDFDDDDEAWKAMLGVKFNDYIGLEVAANDYGETGDDGFTSELTGGTLALVVFVPFTDSFELFIKGGRLWWEDDVTIADETFDDTLDGEENFYGIGMNFNFNETLTLRLEMERYDVELEDDEIGVDTDGDFNLDVASIGLIFNF